MKDRIRHMFTRRIGPGVMVPWYMGRAWYDCRFQHEVVAIMPFNVIMAAARAIWIALFVNYPLARWASRNNMKLVRHDTIKRLNNELRACHRLLEASRKQVRIERRMRREMSL